MHTATYPKHLFITKQKFIKMNGTYIEPDALKNLLNSWNLSELHAYFQSEHIDLDVLKIMKIHHIDELLANFKFGTRIRFEHHFEEWRLAIGIPLQTARSCRQMRHGNQATERQEPSQYEQTFDAYEDCTNPWEICAPITLDNEFDFNTNTKESTPQSPPAPVPVPSPPPLLVPKSISESVADGGGEHVREKRTTKRLLQEERSRHVTVLQILENSGPKSQILLEQRKSNQPLTPTQRFLLIHLIVNYFTQYEYHLSLQQSYKLERQILKLFPCEKLSSYRTEKRGKIYVKFANMKRYRRDNSVKRSSSRNRPQHQNDEIPTMNETIHDAVDTQQAGSPSEIKVKNEVDF